jgi:uncharacterized membrane protein YphA (DoxX/SURF4 family)
VESVVLVLRLLLAAVFAVAGVAKLRDPAGSRKALQDFGAPARLAGPGGFLLPLLEIAVAVALLFPPSARWGALAAVVLLAAFVVAIANALAHGRAPDCHCFGQLHSEPAGRSTLVRNSILIALSGVVAGFGPGPGIHTWVGDRSALELALIAGAVAVAAFGAYKLSEWQRARARKRRKEALVAQLTATYGPAGLPVGSPAPAFTVHGMDGEPRTLDALCEPGLPVVLVFVHPNCIICGMLLPLLAQWRVPLAGRVTIAVISDGTPEDNEPLLRGHDIDGLLLQQNGQVYEAFEFRQGTPAAVVVNPDRTVGSVAVAGQLAIEELIRLTVGRTETPAEHSLTT